MGLIGLGVAAWTDAKRYIISKRLVAVMFSIGIVFATWRYFYPVNARLDYLLGSVLGGVEFGFGVSLFLFISRILYDWILQLFKKESKTLVGGGNIKLIAVMSFFFPANAYTLNLFLAFVLVLLGMVVQLAIKRKGVIPFAPYMFAVWNTIGV